MGNRVGNPLQTITLGIYRLLTMEILFWGVRGSIPVPGPSTVAYGGNTSCISVRLGDRWVIFDAGTGIRVLGEHFQSQGRVDRMALFLSHVHWDHIQGFPFFAPAFRSGNHLIIHGLEHQETTLSGILAGQMEGPNFPVNIDSMGARIDFVELQEGAITPIYDAAGTPFASVANARLNHPNGVLAYRLVESDSGASVVYATDTEHYEGRLDERLVELARGTDLLIYDGMYTPEEYPSHRGWGHSTWLEGLKVCRAAGVPRLVVFHHDPSHDDAFLDDLAARATAEAAASDPAVSLAFAREGMSIVLPGH